MMRRYFERILCIVLVLFLAVNISVIIKKNSLISKKTSNTVIEILRCIDDTKENLQSLIDNEDKSYRNKMMYVINGQFSTLYHLCHANRDIYNFACSDFEYIGGTFIGSAGTRYFTTNGIYDDFEITENGYEYIRSLIALLDKIPENVSDSGKKYNLDALNSNFRDMHEWLYDTEKSPYCYIAK